MIIGFEELQKKLRQMEAAAQALDRLREASAAIRRATEISYSPPELVALDRALKVLSETLGIDEFEADSQLERLPNGLVLSKADYLSHFLEVVEGHKREISGKGLSHICSLGTSYIWKVLHAQLRLYYAVVHNSLSAISQRGIALSIRVQQICATHPATAPPRLA